MSYREQLIKFLATISSAAKLIDYERNVPIAYVPIEITEQFFDLFHPKETKFIDDFSSDELVDIAIFSGYLDAATDSVIASDHPPVREALKIPRWREMMKKASSLLEQLNNRTPARQKTNKPRHDNPYQPPCFDDSP